MLKSTDAGATWSKAGAFHEPIHALAIDPRRPSTLYAASWYSLYVSIDGGATWINSGLVDLFVEALVIDPESPPAGSLSTIYVTAWLDDNQDCNCVLLKSVDGGASWTKTCLGFELDLGNEALAIVPGSPPTLYAGSYDDVFKSVDGGESWTQAGHFDPSGPIPALTIDPSNPSVIYAGAWAAVFKSVDAGASWTVGSGLTGSVIALAVDPSDASTVYAGTSRDGVYRSVDGGASWDAVRTSAGSRRVDALAIDPSDPSTVYAGTWGDGVVKSLDAGVSWSRGTTGLPGDSVRALEIDPWNASTLYAGTSDGVFKSVDGGKSWVGGGLTDTRIDTLAIDPLSSSTLFAGGTEGIFKSVDGGESWRAVNTGLRTPWVTALAIDPSNPAIIHSAGGSQYGSVHSGTRHGWLHKSIDGGESWRVTTGALGGYVALVIDPGNPLILYAGTKLLGVLRSINGGDSWRATGSSGLHGEKVLSLVIDPGNPSTLYAGTHRYGSQGVYKSVDGGTTWALVGSLLPGSVEALAIRDWSTSSAYSGTTIYAGVAFKYYPSRRGLFNFTEIRCAPSSLCLSHDRFFIEVHWRDFAGGVGSAEVVPYGSDDSALLWFFDADNWEMLVKVLDGCRINNRFWVFSAATTNVEYTLRVTDTENGSQRTYFNPLGNAAAAITDVNAFAACIGLDHSDRSGR